MALKYLTEQMKRAKTIESITYFKCLYNTKQRVTKNVNVQILSDEREKTCHLCLQPYLSSHASLQNLG